MDYSFASVKDLFDKYALKQEDGKWVALHRKTNIPYEAEQFVAAVQFAHTWVAATEYNRSRTTPESKIITPDDYYYAFGIEGAHLVYDAIMEQSKQSIQSSGMLLPPEILKRRISIMVPTYKHAASIVEGIYQNPRFATSFEIWARSASETPEYHGQSINGGMHK